MRQQIEMCEHCHKQILVGPVPHDCSEGRVAIAAKAGAAFKGLEGAIRKLAAPAAANEPTNEDAADEAE